jgi:hypothetical protein
LQELPLWLLLGQRQRWGDWGLEAAKKSNSSFLRVIENVSPSAEDRL